MSSKSVSFHLCSVIHLPGIFSPSAVDGGKYIFAADESSLLRASLCLCLTKRDKASEHLARLWSKSKITGMFTDRDYE